MSLPMSERRDCPTRPDGDSPLILQSIPVAVCQGRQREHYHKCTTCVHRNPGPQGAPRPLNGVDRSAGRGVRRPEATPVTGEA